MISHAIFASSSPHSASQPALHPTSRLRFTLRSDPIPIHPWPPPTTPRPFQVPPADFLVREKAGFAHVMSNLGHDVSKKRFNAHAAMKLHRQGAGTDRHH